MKKYAKRHDDLNATLRRLEQYVTVPPFARQFYRFIYEQLGMPGIEADPLDQAFCLLLRLECRRHQAVNRIVQNGQLNLLDILRFGSRIHDLLDHLTRTVNGLITRDTNEEVIRQLVLVECYYHLGRTEDVVRSLQNAIALGCSHPLVQFALGYNTYRHAIEQFTHPTGQKGKVIADNAPAFESACCDAIAAFRAGFGDERYDAQIWWWIGLISEAIGERSDAVRAYQEAMQSDPINFLVPAQEKMRQIEGTTEPSPPADRERLAQLGPITDEEFEESLRLLDEPDVLDRLIEGTSD